MNGNPTAKQTRWHNWLRDKGCAVCYAQAEIHHIEGAKAKKKGVPGWGEWLVIPLCAGHHRYGITAVHQARADFHMLHGSEYGHFARLAKEYGQVPDQAIKAAEVMAKNGVTNKLVRANI